MVNNGCYSLLLPIHIQQETGFFLAFVFVSCIFGVG